MSLSKLSSDYQKVDGSENMTSPQKTRSVPIACRVCDRVFFDNVSLVLHFECHMEDELSILKQHLSLSLSPFSSSQEKMKKACPNMNDCFRPAPLSLSSSITPRNVSPVKKPVINSNPPINAASFDARANLSQPIRRPTVSEYGSTSSSTHPLMYSQLGARSFANGSARLPPLQIREENGRQMRLAQNRHINQLEQPVRETIIISDDEADNNEGAAEIDLELKL